VTALGLADLCALAMLAGLAVYVVTGGADFGGGIWDLLATEPRASAQRKLIERAIAPVWEANHVWLIFVVVVLFSAFPLAYSVASIALHVPLTVMLLGIVMRGSAFVFRQYGGEDERSVRRWGRVFAVASVVTPLFLGVILGAVTWGRIPVEDGLPTVGFFAGWIGLFPAAVGVFTLVTFAYLAAVYLTLEADEPALREDFRRRALAAGIALGPCALAAGLAAWAEAPGFGERLLGSSWTWPIQIGAGAMAIGTLLSLWKRKLRLARVLAVTQVTLIVVGWALAQRPYLVAPDVTIQNAASPESTLSLLLVVVAAGALLLVPSLYYLFRVFRKIE
jgi:cytochrome bd ubiquinol oxidase subunit II